MFVCLTSIHSCAAELNWLKTAACAQGRGGRKGSERRDINGSEMCEKGLLSRRVLRTGIFFVIKHEFVVQLNQL